MIADNVGIVIILITALGYVSNYLNWRFLDYTVTRLLYYVGAFVHESSHAILCILTRAHILEFKVFTTRPHVTSTASRIPVIGEFLINIAPIIGGLAFLFLLNRYFLAGHFIMPAFTGWESVFGGAWNIILQINLWQWQSWVMLLLFLNVGAMIGPSVQDLKNTWLVLLLLCFAQSPFFASLGELAISLIVINIGIQLVAISLIGIINKVSQ